MKFDLPYVSHFHLDEEGTNVDVRVFFGSHERGKEGSFATTIELHLALPVAADDTVAVIRERAIEGARRLLNIEVEAEPPRPGPKEWIEEAMGTDKTRAAR